MRKLNNKKIAVIGGTGFVGLNLSLFLKEKGFEVYALDAMYKKNGLKNQITKLEKENIDIINCDIVNGDNLEIILLKIINLEIQLRIS